MCSDHFHGSDYEGFGAKQMGFASKLILRKGTIPSIHPVPTPDELVAARSRKRGHGSADRQPASTSSAVRDEQMDVVTPKRSARAVSKLTSNRVCKRKSYNYLIYGILLYSTTQIYRMSAQGSEPQSVYYEPERVTIAFNRRFLQFLSFRKACGGIRENTGAVTQGITTGRGRG